MHLLSTVLFLLAVADECSHHFVRPTPAEATCPVTKPNGIAAGGEQSDPDSFGTREISVGPFGLWDEGTVVFKPGGAGFVTSDGSLGMKFGWMRGVRGLLKIEGHRLDAPAPALRSHVPEGYGDLGFQATYLIFPTPGCWEVTAHIGTASVTFVTKVIKIGDGPSPASRSVRLVVPWREVSQKKKFLKNSAQTLPVQTFSFGERQQSILECGRASP